MDALFLAFLLCFLVELGGRVPQLALLLRKRTQAAWSVTLGLLLATGGNAAIAAGLGRSLAEGLTPEARALLFALALLWAGGNRLVPARSPDPLANWRIGAFLTTTFGIFILGFGESAVLLAAGVAADRASPWLAGVGAWLGMAGAALLVPLLSENGFDVRRYWAVRLVPALLFLLAGFAVLVSALRLV